MTCAAVRAVSRLRVVESDYDKGWLEWSPIKRNVPGTPRR